VSWGEIILAWCVISVLLGLIMARCIRMMGDGD
jgi:hypothetical protein